jgi:hypothetical protein
VENECQFLPQDFETIAKCKKRQAEMVARFINNQFPWEMLALARCRSKRCGVEPCVEACHFATRKRRIANIASGIPLLIENGGLLQDVCIVHPLWEARVGELKHIGMDAAKQWTYRRLKLLGADVLGLGIFEVSLNRERSGEIYWAGEVRLITAGAQKDELKETFAIEKRYRRLRPRQRIVVVENVGDLSAQFSYAVKRFVEQRVAYISPSTGRQDRNHLPPPSALWAEHDAWLHALPLGSRNMAFGCGKRGIKFYGRQAF